MAPRAAVGLCVALLVLCYDTIQDETIRPARADLLRTTRGRGTSNRLYLRRKIEGLVGGGSRRRDSSGRRHSRRDASRKRRKDRKGKGRDRSRDRHRRGRERDRSDRKKDRRKQEENQEQDRRYEAYKNMAKKLEKEKGELEIKVGTLEQEAENERDSIRYDLGQLEAEKSSWNEKIQDTQDFIGAAKVKLRRCRGLGISHMTSHNQVEEIFELISDASKVIWDKIMAWIEKKGEGQAALEEEEETHPGIWPPPQPPTPPDDELLDPDAEPEVPPPPEEGDDNDESGSSSDDEKGSDSSSDDSSEERKKRARKEVEDYAYGIDSDDD
mmetsp:Transcript_15985/g.28679  ORF Transcript_15985/g.28679 Transcript_15985/m.28679 type:complete len:327 (-) Transcript_15985:280-1260(-)